ncbi:MAG: tRNA uridine(34) 5-carboxymethylaminomethyl modification radical SAM/GNAT enzyme Elp3 [Candidatus Hadarchaeum sp.]|uniref:tRNA uridine(34) 5-carboxymethylaminomethyl modification radical SAM/GNAT enzyme Elp3 n=1 Tax=Candidatus Hadarchaeum sp. TaxID=2883567 RepID=UPI00316D23E6
MEAFTTASREAIRRILRQGTIDPQGLSRIKTEICREFKLPRPPRNSELLALATPEERSKLITILRLKPVRSISGVTVITVMPKPYPCPTEQTCIYCPGGPDYNTPKSYTGKEPAAARALQHNYDPYAQVSSRIEQLRAIGHEVDKVELVVFGGTLTCYPKDYLEWFITQCLNAITGGRAKSLHEAQTEAEKSAIRVSDIAIETRPDYCRESQVDFLLGLGTTRVELGVQTVYDDVYQIVKRGHTVEDVVEAVRIARDSGFAIVFHMMPNLPGSSYVRDLEMFRTIFSDERFKPDALKIYPTLVLPGTGLYEMWRRGEYKPYSFEKLVDLIIEVKKMTPKWIRIQRIQRDIPANLVAAGVKRGDLRALVQERLKQQGRACRCIRCREVGHVSYKTGFEPRPEDIELVTEKYRASGGTEIFLSFEDMANDVLIGLLRLREPSEKAHRPEVRLGDATIVRELHVYGPLVGVGRVAGPSEWQHRGWGERLLQEAERVSREEIGARKILVLAGIGTREYYHRLGYDREGPYMSKRLVPTHDSKT